MGRRLNVAKLRAESSGDNAVRIVCTHRNRSSSEKGRKQCHKFTRRREMKTYLLSRAFLEPNGRSKCSRPGGGMASDMVYGEAVE